MQMFNLIIPATKKIVPLRGRILQCDGRVHRLDAGQCSEVIAFLSKDYPKPHVVQHGEDSWVYTNDTDEEVICIKVAV